MLAVEFRCSSQRHGEVYSQDSSQDKRSCLMISIELWRARIGQFNGKCRSGSNLYLCFSFVFDPYSRRRKNDVSSQDPDPCSLTTAVASEDSTKRLFLSISSPVSSSISSSSSHDLPQLSTTSHTSSCSSGSCSIKSTLGSSSWLSVLFSFLPSCSLSYYSGVCRSVLREAPLIILLIAGIISHQLIISAGDVETNPGPIACEWCGNFMQVTALLFHYS